jgi:protein SCO1/2
MQRHALILRLALAALLAPCAGAIASRPTELQQAPDLTGAGWVEKPGDTLPLDLSFTDDHGKHVTLRDLLLPGKPVILNLGYFRCPRLCGLVMNGLTAAMKETSLMPGEDYTVLSVTIDATETWKLAAAKKSAALR